MSEILSLERTRNYLHQGDVSTALHLWRNHVRRPARERWDDDEGDNLHWYCCGNPREARALLDSVLQALSPRSARELRRVAGRFG
ncbi:hypothetical protein ACF09C_36185 [Streptomyces sp. NPDC014870]|uniref:hypothetical protein n=1 Tax=Streptomyces sp. NPDC014870 TaxID=3364925 RepID=UPI0036FABD85